MFYPPRYYCMELCQLCTYVRLKNAAPGDLTMQCKAGIRVRIPPVYEARESLARLGRIRTDWIVHTELR